MCHDIQLCFILPDFDQWGKDFAAIHMFWPVVELIFNLIWSVFLCYVLMGVCIIFPEHGMVAQLSTLQIDIIKAHMFVLQNNQIFST